MRIQGANMRRKLFSFGAADRTKGNDGKGKAAEGSGRRSTTRIWLLPLLLLLLGFIAFRFSAQRVSLPPSLPSLDDRSTSSAYPRDPEGIPLPKGRVPRPNGTIHWVPQGDKFLLLYCARGQISNRMACIHNHIVAAALLNRTLVVPLILPPLVHESTMDKHQKPLPPMSYNLQVIWDVARTQRCFGKTAIMDEVEYVAKHGKILVDRVQCWHGPYKGCKGKAQFFLHKNCPVSKDNNTGSLFFNASMIPPGFGPFFGREEARAQRMHSVSRKLLEADSDRDESSNDADGGQGAVDAGAGAGAGEETVVDAARVGKSAGEESESEDSRSEESGSEESGRAEAVTSEAGVTKEGKTAGEESGSEESGHADDVTSEAGVTKEGKTAGEESGSEESGTASPNEESSSSSGDSEHGTVNDGDDTASKEVGLPEDVTGEAGITKEGNTVGEEPASSSSNGNFEQGAVSDGQSSELEDSKVAAFLEGFSGSRSSGQSEQASPDATGEAQEGGAVRGSDWAGGKPWKGAAETTTANESPSEQAEVSKTLDSAPQRSEDDKKEAEEKVEQDEEDRKEEPEDDKNEDAEAREGNFHEKTVGAWEASDGAGVGEASKKQGEEEEERVCAEGICRLKKDPEIGVACMKRIVKPMDFVAYFSRFGDRMLVLGDLVNVLFREHKTARYTGVYDIALPPWCADTLLVGPAQEVLDAARVFVGAHIGTGQFVGVHWRRGDFEWYCAFYTLRPFRCFYSPRQAAKCIVETTQAHNLTKILLVTNAAQPEIDVFTANATEYSEGKIDIIRPDLAASQEAFRNVRNALNTRNSLRKNFTLVGVPPKWDNMFEVVHATVEKLMIAQSEVFLGSVDSTFTVDVERLRFGIGTASPNDSYVCFSEEEWPIFTDLSPRVAIAKRRAWKIILGRRRKKLGASGLTESGQAGDAGTGVEGGESDKVSSVNEAGLSDVSSASRRNEGSKHTRKRWVRRGRWVRKWKRVKKG